MDVHRHVRGWWAAVLSHTHNHPFAMLGNNQQPQRLLPERRSGALKRHICLCTTVEGISIYCKLDSQYRLMALTDCVLIVQPRWQLQVEVRTSCLDENIAYDNPQSNSEGRNVGECCCNDDSMHAHIDKFMSHGHGYVSAQGPYMIRIQLKFQCPHSPEINKMSP